MNKILDNVIAFEERFLIIHKPTRQFFRKVGIGQKRWRMLLRKQADPAAGEIERLAKYFGVKPSDIYEFKTTETPKNV